MSHPLHPALVHFPIACWSLASFADLAGLFHGEPVWSFAAALMAIGVIAALAAMATGLLEFIKLGPGHPAERVAQRHMAWALAAWCCYATSLVLRVRGMQPIEPGGLSLAASALGFGSLAVAGWLGGQLVYSHRLGGASG